MTWLDKLLRRWRIHMALREVPAGARLLDVGTYDGMLFRVAGTGGVGIDPILPVVEEVPAGVRLVKGNFPADLRGEPDASFESATLLAVVEHIPRSQLAEWSHALARLVGPGGVVVMTVPSPAVDHILHVLMRLRLVAGMEAHQHHGFEPDDVPQYFSAPCWHLRKRKTFQLGLNNLFVFLRADVTERSTL